MEQLHSALLNWLTTLGVALVAVLVAALVHSIGNRIVRRATQSMPLASAIVKAIRSPSRWMLPLIALNLVWQDAPDDLRGLPSVQRWTALALVVCFTWMLVRAINGFSHAYVEHLPVRESDNLQARRLATQARALTRTLAGLVTLLGLSLALMTFPAIRQVGASLLASAGVVGIIAGFAARPVLGNMIAGLQIGLTQPIRIDDVVIVEGEWGVIEEINSSYVVVRIWDQRRMIVPLQWWIEHPFQNWTRQSADLIGTVFIWVDYRMPLEPLRAELQRACEASKLWDHRLAMLQVTEAGEHAMQLRALVTAASSSAAWDLRCEIREALISFIQREHPDSLPRWRAESADRHSHTDTPVTNIAASNSL
jgi:small-conductance mechanosensitive channel